MRPLILIAESDGEMLTLLERYLHLRGYRVDAAVGGAECLAKLADLHPDVLILDEDLSWGGSNGVLTRMQEDDDVPLTPTLVLYHPLEPPDPAYRAVVGKLEKPFHLCELADKAYQAVQAPPSGEGGKTP
ncbi:MAG: hypothetical protein AB7K24_17425 [Gemmataceae bacterium]